MSKKVLCIVHIQIQIWIYLNPAENPFLLFCYPKSKTRNFSLLSFHPSILQKLVDIFLSTLFFLFCYCLIFSLLFCDDRLRCWRRSWTRRLWRPRRLCWARQAALWPCLWNPFYAFHIALYYCCIGIMMRWYPRWWFAIVNSSLILALCMTLSSYEGYAGGSR